MITLTEFRATVIVDLSLLRTQKRELVMIPEDVLTTEQSDALAGIVELCNAIQDQASDLGVFKEEDIYFLEDDEPSEQQ